MEGGGNCIVRRAVWTVCKLERIECVGEAGFDLRMLFAGFTAAKKTGLHCTCTCVEKTVYSFLLIVMDD